MPDNGTMPVYVLLVAQLALVIQPKANNDHEVIVELQKAVERCPAYGFSKLLKMLRSWGHGWNHKRIYRIYCELNRRRKGKKCLPTRSPEPLNVPIVANQCWSIDFMSDSLQCRLRYRTFNLVDDFNREALAIEEDLSLPAQRVVSVLERIITWRGYLGELLSNVVYRDHAVAC